MENKKRRRQIQILARGIGAFLLVFLILIFAHILRKEVNVDNSESVADIESVSEEETDSSEENVDLIPVSVQDIETVRVSSKKIKISWPDDFDDIVKTYIVKKRDMQNSKSNWEVVQVIESDMTVDEEVLSVEDQLESSLPQQYEYRVDVEVADESQFLAEDGRALLSSNVMICIDPGHFSGRNAITGEQSYGYAEGDFTLRIALELRDILKEEYGIDSCMTRTTGSITIDGYTNEKLDKGHISLRGEYTSRDDCDLFVSIHTNANDNYANGYETCMQPIGVNKPIVLVNTLGCDSDIVINASNSIGTNLAKANYDLGIATVEEFTTVEKGKVSEWTNQKNDLLGLPGSVYCRLGSEGDFYGVLKGAASVNKPGIIIEHGHHTVAEVRKEAMQGDLKTIWAKADAYGIAYGFGFVSEMEMP